MRQKRLKVLLNLYVQYSSVVYKIWVYNSAEKRNKAGAQVLVLQQQGGWA